MSKSAPVRLVKAAKEFNLGIHTIVEFLARKGHVVEANPNSKLSPELYALVSAEFGTEKSILEESRRVGLEHSAVKHETLILQDEEGAESRRTKTTEPEDLFIRGTSIEVEAVAEPKTPEKKAAKKEKEPLAGDETPGGKAKAAKEEKAADEADDKGPKILGKIDVDDINTKTRPARKSKEEKDREKAEQKQKLVEEKKAKEAAKEEAELEARAAEEKLEEEKKAEEEKAKLEAEAALAAEKKAAQEAEKKKDFLETRIEKLSGPKVLGKIELPKEKEKKPKEKKPVASSSDPDAGAGKRKRKRIKGKEDEKDRPARTGTGRGGKKKDVKYEPSEEEIQKQMKETLARLTAPTKSKGAKLRRAKRDAIRGAEEEKQRQLEAESNIIKVTEFVTANELANMMSIPVTDVISTCMAVGLFVSINQRLDAETISIVADEFGFKVEFVSADVQDAIEEEAEDDPDTLTHRSPIVTVMGHVDHGKTSLLDYIRNANVIAGEAGGITQHIGAYEVTLEDGRSITFLDTPGHEAFTAMRARGAKITDVAVIVVAADDSVMPQTREAINHAQAAGVPIVFAINKIDKAGANPEKIKEELANMNLLVEDWGGKIQSQDISAKKGINVEQLLEKVLLEAELLDLKANPDRLASGTVLESSLDKGRGYVAKVLVQTGTLKVGDMMLAGICYGKVKAMYNERNLAVKSVGPSTPVLMLGLNGAPQAGDTFNIMTDEREVKNIATKRQQLQREQGYRSTKHITLDEIGRRIAIGDFKQLQVIVKGDVDGSVEALSDALLKLSTDQVQVEVIHRSVGAVTETDVMLASASDAIVVAFQVRPTLGARKLAEAEQIDIRQYSIIYQATEEIKSAIEGMLSPEIQEKVVCNIEVRDVFKITKVGTVAGCMVLDGKVTRNTTIRVIRDGIVIYTGKLGSLKRFKDDVKEVQKGYECGLNVENFNDIKVGDIIEGYEEIEVKRKL